MRIGNLEDLENAKNSENFIHFMQSEPHKNQSKLARCKNWWYYNKWYVICGIILLGIACDLTRNVLGLGQPSFDFQIAYIGESTLPQDTITALEHAFASLGGDLNGDGKVIVHINQYVDHHQDIDADAVYYQTASEIALISDISNCESYFFLTDNPGRLQREQQILACPDGSCPEKTDYSTEDKVLLWADCPALSELDLESYSINTLGQSQTKNTQELLSKLYIGRRCFYTDARTDNAEQCSKLWDKLTDR